MAKRTLQYMFTTLALLLSLAVNDGCALLSARNASDPAAAPTEAHSEWNQVQAVPVEIAADISRLKTDPPPDWRGAWQTPPPTPPASPREEEAADMPAPSEPAPLAPPTERKPSSVKSELAERYTVRTGDTLMKISFEKFGNVYRWREILDANRERIADFNHLVRGTVLTIQGVEYVVIEKNGVPYLIRKNDSLVKIADHLYGDRKEWRGIWKNNPHLIRNPNKIYAGFTLYYVPKAVRSTTATATAK